MYLYHNCTYIQSKKNIPIYICMTVLIPKKKKYTKITICTYINNCTYTTKKYIHIANMYLYHSKKIYKNEYVHIPYTTVLIPKKKYNIKIRTVLIS